MIRHSDKLWRYTRSYRSTTLPHRCQQRRLRGLWNQSDIAHSHRSPEFFVVPEYTPLPHHNLKKQLWKCWIISEIHNQSSFPLYHEKVENGAKFWETLTIITDSGEWREIRNFASYFKMAEDREKSLVIWRQWRTMPRHLALFFSYL